MSKLYIDGTNAPGHIKAALHQLSKNIDFSREDHKAGNGYVFFGVNRITDTNVAVKFYYWGGKTEYHAEPKQLAQIESENVLKIHDAALLDGNWAYFITPDCAQGDLDDVMQANCVGNRDALDFAYQALSGLSHLHAKRYLHRDIKPANLYMTDAGRVVIGDFGSVKRMPEGSTVIPASSHALLYRPAESITTNLYGVSGDVYQAGLVLYQLLGGALPYDGRDWLSVQQLRHYESLPVSLDQQDFVDQCIRARIIAGKVMDHRTLPPWVSKPLRRLLNKACQIDSEKRFPNASSFMAAIHELRPTVLDWGVVDGVPTLSGQRSYRIVSEDAQFIVQKRTGNNWRRDNTLVGQTLPALVQEISVRVQDTL